MTIYIVSGRTDCRVGQEWEDKWVKKRNENVESIGKDEINWEKSIFSQFAVATLLFVVFVVVRRADNIISIFYIFSLSSYIGAYWNIDVQSKRK